MRTLCDKEAVVRDSWFNTAQCEDHKDIPPTIMQKNPEYWRLKKEREKVPRK